MFCSNPFRLSCAMAATVLAATSGSAFAHNYNNTRSNRSMIISGDTTTQWSTQSAVFLDVGDFDGDGASGNLFFQLDPPASSEVLPFSTGISVAGLDSYTLAGAEAINLAPTAGRTLTASSEEFGGDGVNLSAASHTINSADAGGFDAVSQTNTMITDLGVSVAYTSDRLTIQANSDAQLEVDFDAFGDFDLDLLSGQTATTVVAVEWSFSRMDLGGLTPILAQTIVEQQSTLDGLSRNGITPFSVATPTDLAPFDLQAGESYYLNIDVVTFSQIVPAPPTVAAPMLLGLLAARRRR